MSRKFCKTLNDLAQARFACCCADSYIDNAAAVGLDGGGTEQKQKLAIAGRTSRLGVHSQLGAAVAWRASCVEIPFAFIISGVRTDSGR